MRSEVWGVKSEDVRTAKNAALRWLFRNNLPKFTVSFGEKSGIGKMVINVKTTAV